MSDIVITNVNHSFVKVYCTESIAWELRDAFSYRVPGFQFIPSYKAKLWDGFIRLYNVNTKLILRGMVPSIIEWATRQGYDYAYEDEPADNNFSVVEAQEFIDTINPKHPPRDYQVDGFVHAIRSRRKIIVSPTGSGKSLLQYLIFLYLMKQGKRGLLIVPRTQLVEQMVSDFEDYSCNNKKDMTKYCHKLYSGKDKKSDKPLIVSTWQSLQNFPADYFKQFDYVILDECHSAIEKSVNQKAITKIISNCVNAEYRIGVTGTLPNEKGGLLSLEGLFGETHKTISTKELMDKNQLADLKIKCLILEYTDSERSMVSKATYEQEMRYIVTHPERNRFITNLALSLKGNTLLLFNYVELQGKVLYDMISAKAKDRKVFFIHGGTDVEDRELIRKIVETETDAIIVGSVGVLSTGTNIVNISNAIFASPSKSKIRNLQSLGRILRTSGNKTSATLFDVADDFSRGKKVNYTMNHFYERVKIYAHEGFKFKLYKIRLGNMI